MSADLIANAIPGYELLDSGSGRKLERIAGRTVIRPCSQAVWAAAYPDQWADAASECRRKSTGGGTWIHHEPLGPMEISWRGEHGSAVRFGLRLTEFGHCGVFFEQEPLWRHFQSVLGSGQRFANLFGYTGSASLAVAAAGTDVFHVDSARGVVDWGQANQNLSGLDGASLKWIVDDVRSFLRLSRKRGWSYDVVFADPPSFGHGKKKNETWNWESDIAEMVADCAAVVAPGGELVLSCHTPGAQREALVNLLRSYGQVTAGELGVAHANDDRILPAGIYARVAC
ncbi:MAG: class I SAM-dependent methyltransferase [Planctomycetota bacterium]|nr:class I SAM-dependent methyltransferase [Planctomycetota bacterium]